VGKRGRERSIDADGNAVRCSADATRAGLAEPSPGRRISRRAPSDGWTLPARSIAERRTTRQCPGGGPFPFAWSGGPFPPEEASPPPPPVDAFVVMVVVIGDEYDEESL
jgi:hypothetical protein